MHNYVSQYFKYASYLRIFFSITMHFLTANRHTAKTTKINKDTKKLEKGFLFSALHCLKLES